MRAAGGVIDWARIREDGNGQFAFVELLAPSTYPLFD